MVALPIVANWSSITMALMEVNTIRQQDAEQNTKQSPGPHVMYETTTLTGIPRESSRISLDKPVAPFDISEKNYSSLIKLLRVSAWALRFIRKLQKKSTVKGQLTSDEISQAKVMWEKHVQNSPFTPEIHVIKQNSRNNLKNQLCSSMKMEYLGAMVDWSVKTSQNMLRSQNSFQGTMSLQA